jgi:endonuclease-3
MMSSDDIERFFATLAAANPHPQTELEFTSVFELLAAVLLSAQATDVSVNKATRTLFAQAPTPQAMLDLGLDRVTEAIRTIGLFRTKAKNLLQTCRILVDQHGGEVPRTREALEALPGVGRKTANVVLNVAFGEPTMAVDTHIFRVANRTGLAPGRNPLEVEQGLLQRVPAEVPGGCTPLADPARPLRLPGAQPAVQPLQRAPLVRPGPAPTIGLNVPGGTTDRT